MKYIVAKRGLALAAGFTMKGHRHNTTEIILNEKELSFSTTVPGATLEEKAASLEGEILNASEIHKILKDYA